MTGPIRIIAIINQDLAQHPALAHLKSPVTVDHTPYPCPRCNAMCWIGPKQKLAAALGQGEPICYHCMFTDPELRQIFAGENYQFQSLNPDIENRPRRWQ